MTPYTLEQITALESGAIVPCIEGVLTKIVRTTEDSQFVKLDIEGGSVLVELLSHRMQDEDGGSSFRFACYATSEGLRGIEVVKQGDKLKLRVKAKPVAPFENAPESCEDAPQTPSVVWDEQRIAFLKEARIKAEEMALEVLAEFDGKDDAWLTSVADGFFKVIVVTGATRNEV